jgi:hypothetical protein
MKSGTSRVQRHLAAILAPDAVGFSAVMDGDYESAQNPIKAPRQVVISPAIHLNTLRFVGILE